MKLQSIITGSHQATDQERIDEAMAESFPASDPPSWTSGLAHKASPPKREAATVAKQPGEPKSPKAAPPATRKAK